MNNVKEIGRLLFTVNRLPYLPKSGRETTLCYTMKKAGLLTTVGKHNDYSENRFRPTNKLWKLFNK